jgi:putative iron-only hydrogenase system regulator
MLFSDPKELPMEKRIGVVAILIEGRGNIPAINSILSNHSDIINGRMGLPFKDRGVQIISLIVEGTPDQINALTGPLGRLKGVQVKSILTRAIGDDADDHRDTNFS